jgi:hypothetical protein
MSLTLEFGDGGRVGDEDELAPLCEVVDVEAVEWFPAILATCPDFATGGGNKDCAGSDVPNVGIGVAGGGEDAGGDECAFECSGAERTVIPVRSTNLIAHGDRNDVAETTVRGAASGIEWLTVEAKRAAAVGMVDTRVERVC